tara:strand:+ start:562 stop:1341 length:780 start_codon:yes stop_codon:yes gene_type:complete
MPEAPEVRVMSKALAALWSGQTLQKVEVLSGRYLKKDLTGLQLINQNLPLKIIGIGAHGKFSYAIIENEIFAWFTMGMSGNWSKTKTNHSRVKFTFNNFETYFDDIRNFGTIKFVRGKHKMIEKLESLGHDIIAEDISSEEYILRMNAKANWPLAKVLMDQSIIAGIGNYIKADSLWLAKLSPKKLVKDCSEEELINLKNCVRRVMLQSLQANPNSISYKSNSSKFLIYGKKEDPDGNPVIKETTADKRNTYWCPKVQS